MSPIWIFFEVVCLFASTSFGTPIRNGEDVGSVKTGGKATIVTGQRKYPFIVHITIYYKQNKQNLKSYCGGVIIGLNTVLTAGHCLHNKPNPTIYVHAGIVDTKYEQKDGQTLLVEGYLKHEKFQKTCKMANGRCCYANNDIGILWTEDNFRFGLTIQKAILNKEQQKPIGQEGFILGWGLDSQNKQPSMLQKGLMKVLPKKECEFDGEIFISNNVMCLGPVSGGTRTNSGDSGGPFISEGVVYGLSSFTASKQPCQSQGRQLNVFTYVESYLPWINATLFNGPPQKGKPKHPKNCKNSKTCHLNN